MAQKIAAAADRAGGRVYYVGGCVRDGLLGRESKDIDLEVHGIPVSKLEEILDGLGERIAKGVSFGVFGLRHCGLDIAMPRSEKATGRGHKDFAVFVDPFLGEEKAARRRDFTVNALMQNVLTGEILDFFGGREDLQNGIIRHVDDGSFGEDPLRVFRAAQFAARFDFAVAEETRALCASMAVDALAGERVFAELEKALLKAEKPSLFFEELRRMRQLTVWFPELEALIGVPQRPDAHPEGDVWEHTMQVLDAAASLRQRAENPLGLMLAALCHDFGKADTTESMDGVLHAYGHEKAGLPPAERFLGRLTGEKKLRQYVRSMVLLHMEPNKRLADGAGEKSFMRLFDSSVCPEDLLLLAEADFLGRRAPGTDGAALAAAYAEVKKRLWALLDVYRERMAQPGVSGQDLVDAGFAPGENFHLALAYAHKLRLAGLSKEDQLRQTLGYLRSLSKEKTT